eukprot:g7870.t1
MKSPKNIFSSLDFFGRHVTRNHLLYCEGHRENLCDRRRLCELSIEHRLDGEFAPACFFFPQDKEKAKKAFTSNAERMYVFKKIDPRIHRGQGVSFMTGTQALTVDPETLYDKGSGYGTMVQEYLYPHIWPKMNRKPEFRIYFVLSSVSPLRAYAAQIWVTHAPSPYTTAAKQIRNPCVHACNAHRANANERCENAWSEGARQNLFPDWATRNEVSESVKDKIEKSIHHALQLALLVSQKDAAKHPWHDKLKERGANCYTYYRADLGVGPESEGYKAKIIEVNEYPSIGESIPRKKQMQRDDLEALFRITHRQVGTTYKP